MKIRLIFKKMRKINIEIAQNGSPSPRGLPGGLPNIFKSRYHQNLPNTIYRIEFGFVEKKIKFDN